MGAAPAAAGELVVGGLTPFTSIDYPGRLAAVVFVQGCPWRCGYCHNPHLQARAASALAPSWAEVRHWLQRRRGLVDAVVFSGGEPTLDMGLPAAVAQVREMGFAAGLHTAGIYPARLQALLPLLDWVGLDVKAPLDDEAAHARVTGVRGAATAVRRSLAVLVDSGVAHECRTTAHPQLLDETALLRLAAQLSACGVRRWALQVFRSTGCRGGLPAVGADWPSAPVLARLGSSFESFALRRG